MPDRTPRPSPDALLRSAAREGKGRLKIFLGAAPGVGKTFEMLSEGAARLAAGADVVVAIVETHGRAETQALVAPLPVVPRRTIDYRGRTLEEMDLDAVLARRPALALVDEYAHTNAAGSRHPKRWQDVAELLDAGIDVYTTLNIQHVESLNDVVASFTHVRVRETVPDSVFEHAEIEIVDIPPAELIDRLKAGKVYVPAEATRALDNFFSRQNLSALREMALTRAAQSVDRRMVEELDAGALAGTFGAERVLVAVHDQEGTEVLVRAAKRLADALRAPWTAVHIETARDAGFDAAQRRRIADALRLATGLGATISTIPAESVVSGLLAQVAAMRATQLVVGKSQRSWWFALRHGSVVESLLRGTEGLAVHVIPAPTVAPPRRAAPRRASTWGSPRDHAVVALLVAAATMLARVAQPWIGTGPVDMLYLLPVMFAAAAYGLRHALVAGIGAALAFNFFFLPPLYTFTIADPQSVLTMLALLGVAAVTSRLAGRLRSQAQLGVRGAQESAALAAFAQTLAGASDEGATAALICRDVGRLLGVDAILLSPRDGLLKPVDGDPTPAPLGPVDQAAAEWSWTRGEAAGHDTQTLNAADWQFHPLKTSLGVLAVLGVSRDDGGDPVPADRAVLLSILVGQAALAHERLHLEGEVRSASVLKERDRLRVALLSSIGHDLRTPLTGVSAAIDAIAAEHGNLAALPLARAEVARLRRFLDNLVDMVRLDSGALRPSPEVVDLADAVDSALIDVHDLVQFNPVALALPPDLPLIRADARLLHHVLINLLANAAQHGGAGTITIEGRAAAGGVALTVRDQGPGIAEATAGHIFETFVQGQGGDSGLGLAIVKGFADAMGIAVAAANHADGGGAFTLSVPAGLVVRGEDGG